MSQTDICSVCHRHGRECVDLFIKLSCGNGYVPVCPSCVPETRKQIQQIETEDRVVSTIFNRIADGTYFPGYDCDEIIVF